MDNKTQWWSEEYGFFGNHYLEGDNSQEGYLAVKKQTLTERTTTEVEGIIRLLKLTGKESVLDVPCGYGRHDIELAKKGFSVTGIDINTTHLQKAIEAGEKAGVSVTFEKGNMLDISYKEEFDIIINMFISLGFFETEEENNAVLKNFYNALKPGGKFLFHTDVNIPRILAGTYKENETRNLVSGKTLRITEMYDVQTKRLNGSWIIIDKEGDENKKDYSVRVYTKDEFVDLCKQAGFTHFEIYGGWNGEPYSDSSEDMIIIAKK